VIESESFVFQKTNRLYCRVGVKQTLRRVNVNNLNSVLLEGALVKDPELFERKAGPVCRLLVESGREYMVPGSKEESRLIKEYELFPVQVFNRTAEVCVEYLRQGRGVRVVGRLSRADNPFGDTFCIVAEHVEFKPKKVEEAKSEDE
jgi:single-strand DNA-binding protein